MTSPCPLGIVDLKIIRNSHFAADIPCYGVGFMPNIRALERSQQRIQMNSRRKLLRLIIG
jgi:hypothetical protein